MLGEGGFKGLTIVEYCNYKPINELLLPFQFKYTSSIAKNEIIYNEIAINLSFEKSILNIPEYRPNIVMENNGEKVTIPFTGDYRKLKTGVVYLKVKINDAPQEYEFMLDSGASLSAINTKLVSKLGLELIGKLKATGMGDKSRDINFVKVKALHLNGIDIIDCHLATLPDLDVDGILGYDFISQMTIEINYKDEVIVCHQPHIYTPYKEACKIPLKILWNKPYVDTLINNKEEALLLIDSGAVAKDLCLYSDFADKASIRTEGSGISIGIGGIAETQDAYLESFKFGNYFIPIKKALVFKKRKYES